MENIEIANAFFLVYGKGKSNTFISEVLNKTDSFDLALTNAEVPTFNYQPVSSIIPPRCELISAKIGKSILNENKGAFVKAVMARESTFDEGFVAAAVAVAFPEKEEEIGYVAECHGVFDSFSDAENMLKETELAAKVWLNRKHSIPKKEVASVLSCVKSEGGLWVTALAMAVFIQPCFNGLEQLSTS